MVWAKGDLADHTNERVRLATKKLFDESKVFIMTLGLSEVWINTQSLEVFGVAYRKLILILIFTFLK